MSGLTLTQEFNNYFSKNYFYLLSYASLKNQREKEDILHDVFLKCYRTISLSGFSGHTFSNYIRRAIKNAATNKYRDNNVRNNVELEPSINYTPTEFTDSYESEAEMKLLIKTEEEEQQKEYDYEVNFKHTMAFEYVNKYFSERDKMVFKTYYVLKYKHLNYKQLASATNMSQSTVSNIIKNIKKELKKNLECYLNTNMNIMELNEKVLKVETLLQKDLRHNLGEYKSYYLLIFSKSWSGCGCNLNQIRESLKAWLIKNKAILAEEQKNKIIL